MMMRWWSNGLLVSGDLEVLGEKVFIWILPVFSAFNGNWGGIQFTQERVISRECECRVRYWGS